MEKDLSEYLFLLRTMGRPLHSILFRILRRRSLETKEEKMKGEHYIRKQKNYAKKDIVLEYLTFFKPYLFTSPSKIFKKIK